MKWKQYLAVMTAAAMVISGPAVPMSQVFAADAVAAEVQASDETTDEKVITLPSAGEKLSVEAEDFTLAKKEGNDYIRIAERDWASGGKIVDWFENGNAMSIKFNAPKAGIYAVTATYRSGRKDTDTPNAFEWEGTNVESGSVDVYGEDKATTTHTVTFFVKVTKEGEGTLTFKAGEKAGPQVDKFDIEQAYTLPTGDDTLTVEAEDFTLVPKAGEDTSKHIHVIENTEWASGKKMVSWFENGDAMYMNFYAPAAGDYSVTATYRSGRLKNNPNEFTWEGTNVESGSVDVYGESGATTTHTVTFTVKVTQAGAGVLKFTATNPKCGGQVDKFEFKKKANVAVEGVTLDQTTATLTAKGQTLQLNANVTPEDASNKKVTFASDKEEVATVDATTGVVTAVANGEAKITATTEDGSKTAVCTVTVDIKDTTQPEDADAPKTWGATPNDEQLWYMKQGTAAFCHFGPNTFNNVEWGENYGTKTPKEIFKLTKKFNAEDLVKAVKEAGFSRLILTAKHHDGFCLWSSQYTDYDIASTDYQGDILEEISDACTKYNLDMGCYLSPWDIHEDKYGCFGDNNNKKNNNNTGTFTDYNKLYVAWINEICQAKKADGSYKYGNNNPNRRSDRFVEWWMDGAQGSASNRQTYDWKAILGAIKNNNPHCQVFGTGKAVNGKNGEEDKKLAGTGGIHWIGNESGWASNETWAKINIGEDYETLPKSDGAYIGVSNGVQWSVPEVDTKMLAGWFWRDSAGDDTTKSESELADIYFRTVGRGATLLMNLSPNKNGEVGATQLNRFKELGKNISDTFKTDLTKASGVTATADSTWKNSDKYGAAKVLDTIPEGEVYDNTYWAPAEGKTTGSLEINLGGLKKFDVVSIEEYIQKGQTIAAFTVEYKDLAGQWHDFASGKTISAKRLCRGETVEGTAIRINITEAKDTPKICNVGVYKASKGFSVSSDGSSEAVPSNLKKVSINDATREGTWNFEKDEDGNANGSAWGDTAGLAATFTFTGTKAWVVGTADPNHGMMDVYIDGKKVDSVNTQKSPRKMGAVLYTTPDLEYGTHTIKLARSTKALGISKIYYADGSGIFTMKQSEYELMYGGTTEVEITRTGGTKGQAKVNYVTQSAGAEQGVNYTDLAGSVTFEDGETSKKITLTGLENEKADRMVDGKDFYFTLTSDNASIGTANYAHITLYNANVEKTAERIAAMDLTGYTAESVKVLNDAMSEMKALGTTATKDQVKAAVKKVLDAKNALRAADENNPAYEAVTGVSLDKTTAKLTEKGQTVELKATVAPATASIKDVSFATSDANVATVDANGKVTAVGNGTATITVTTDDGNKTAICSVTVELPAEPTPDPVPADLVQKVNNEIAAAADKKEADYTADSWKNYQKALEAATKAAKDEKATKTDLEKALADLQTAAAKLQKKAPETPSTDSKNPTVGTEAKVGKGIYRVTNAKKKTVVLVKPRKVNNTSFNVPKSVKLANGRYKVVGIEKNAFKNNRKLKKVVIGSQVTKIGANAFSGAKNLKTITIKSKSLKSVGKNAFKGINKKCKIKVPAKKLNSYKKLLSKKGQKASVKITK
ncbi:putative uncharacterized protein [Firmicutes bacterium CAG:56]|jgi:alpha-L-fucosidase/uncharacterized protein YjdB|nr:putative uncharacterized protein [Firmicutes bacterium CAG:56]